MSNTYIEEKIQVFVLTAKKNIPSNFFYRK